MHLQVARLRVVQQPAEQRRGSRLAFGDVGLDHHVLRVEGARRDEARRDDVGHGTDRLEGVVGDAAHVDRVRRTVRRVRRLVLVVEEQQLLAEAGVRHAHAAWHARVVGDDAPDAALLQLGIGEIEQGAKGLGRKPGDAKRHDVFRWG